MRGSSVDWGDVEDGRVKFMHGLGAASFEIECKFEVSTSKVSASFRSPGFAHMDTWTPFKVLERSVSVLWNINSLTEGLVSHLKCTVLVLEI